MNNKEEQEEKRIVVLKQLLFDREMPDLYKDMEGSVFYQSSSSYSENMGIRIYDNSYINGAAKYVREKIKGEIVVDLGCGKTSTMYAISLDFGAGLYVGIDLSPSFFFTSFVRAETLPPYEKIKAARESKPTNNFETFQEPKCPPPISFAISSNNPNSLEITGDMLQVISQIKDDSVNVVIASGLEMIGGKTFNWGKELEQPVYYGDELRKEIVRILKPSGILINYDSCLYFNGAEPDDEYYTNVEFTYPGHPLHILLRKEK